MITIEDLNIKLNYFKQLLKSEIVTLYNENKKQLDDWGLTVTSEQLNKYIKYGFDSKWFIENNWYFLEDTSESFSLFVNDENIQTYNDLKSKVPNIDQMALQSVEEVDKLDVDFMKRLKFGDYVEVDNYKQVQWNEFNIYNEIIKFYKEFDIVAKSDEWKELKNNVPLGALYDTLPDQNDFFEQIVYFVKDILPINIAKYIKIEDEYLEFTYAPKYKDIVFNSKLFEKYLKVEVSKLIRSFTKKVQPLKTNQFQTPKEIRQIKDPTLYSIADRLMRL